MLDSGFPCVFSGGEFLCAMVPLVSETGAHMGGRHSGGACKVPRQRWQDTLCKGGVLHICHCPLAGGWEMSLLPGMLSGRA